MKLLTLNTHSLIEENYQQKTSQFIKTVLEEKPDIIALQEVNQSMAALPAGGELLSGYVPCQGQEVPVREDNHAAQVAKQLRSAGLSCSWTWISAKTGYEIYDEGMALLCLEQKITATDAFFISNCHDYNNWKTRKVLGIQADGCKDWFYTVHMGWWQDEEEPFASQWERLDTALQPKKKEGTAWLMGDFNSPAEFRNQGYDLIGSAGWHDTYKLAEEKDDGITVKGVIDGWRPLDGNQPAPKGMRMDHIWCSKPLLVQNTRVLFNGKNEPEVSDHFGVLIVSG